MYRLVQGKAMCKGKRLALIALGIVLVLTSGYYGLVFLLTLGIV